MPVFIFEDQRAVTERVLVNEATSPADLAQADLVRTEDNLLELAVRQHARLVYRVVYSVLRDHHDAEDAVQETFLRVLRYHRKLAEVRDPRTWLARVAWRVAIERRKKPAEVSLSQMNSDAERVVMQIRSADAGADEILLTAEMSCFLAALIAALPAKLRDPLTLSTVEEMSPADIAEVLGLNEAAVRSRLFRARQMLREKLKILLDGSHETSR